MLAPAPAERPIDREGARARIEPAALLGLAVLTVVWVWWGWREGAYFSAVFLPGLIVLCLGAALFFGFAPSLPSLRSSRPLQLALGALAALAVWTLVSAIWSPAPDVAVEDAQRAISFLLAFAIGLTCSHLLGSRMGLSLVPLSIAAAIVGAITIFLLATGDTPRDLLSADGTLNFPLGYRNANAAFFAIAMFSGLGLATDIRRDWRLRGVGLGAASLCIAIVVLSQSRGSMVAIGVAIVVFCVLAPVRLRAICWLVLAALPALLIVGPAATLYDAVGDQGARNAVDELHAAGVAGALVGVIATVLGAAAALAGRRVPALGTDDARHNRGVVIGFALLLVAGTVGFVAAVGNPATWLGDRLDEFTTAGSPNLSDQATRFSFNARSNRKDLWNVALDDFAQEPLLGAGAGGFQYAYTRERAVDDQDALDAHSVELELLSELGLPGLAFFATAVGAAVLMLIRARRLGPAPAALAAAAAGAGSYWLIHSSVDWFWTYPGLTAPAFALLGAACAPAVGASRPQLAASRRYLLAAVLGVIAVSAVPPFLSDRYVESAGEIWPEDLERAYDDLSAAQRLNPLSDWPLLIEGEIARRAGDRSRAIAAFTEAIAKRPEEWAGRYRLAQLSARTDPGLARRQVRAMLRLNPLDASIRALAEQLGVRPNAGG